jgi:hypothetical protein
LTGGARLKILSDAWRGRVATGFVGGARLRSVQYRGSILWLMGGWRRSNRKHKG